MNFTIWTKKNKIRVSRFERDILGNVSTRKLCPYYTDVLLKKISEWPFPISLYWCRNNGLLENPYWLSFLIPHEKGKVSLMFNSSEKNLELIKMSIIITYISRIFPTRNVLVDKPEEALLSKCLNNSCCMNGPDDLIGSSSEIPEGWKA